MRVAVVLKEDQPTGKLTYGEVDALLTPSDFHPRGIKVRLRDGQVGRVQRIVLDGGNRQVEPDAPRHEVVILVVIDDDGGIYRRQLRDASGDLITAIGIELPVAPGESADHAAEELVRRTLPGKRELRHLVSADTQLADGALRLHAYVSEGNTPLDPEARVWDVAGFAPPDELEAALKTGALSPESRVILRLLQQGY